jgi:competence protein ComEC
LEAIQASDNANSVALCVEFAGRRVLLPGDLEGAGLARLLQSAEGPFDVIMAPHHGSVHSDPAGVAGWAAPAWVIVSDQEPAAAELVRAYAAAGARIRDTARFGALQVRIDRAGGLSVHHWAGRAWSR